MSAEPLHNALAGETSPYLQQHADNPVAWQPWGSAALARARREDKPILLSIGYSACHWCHVMAHESFEDPETAAVMNELFINIKVDREERPDLDKIYQTAHQMLAQRPGGWPLTMFLTPDDRTPFFGGTYFPKVSRHGLPAFTDLLRGVANAYREQQAEIRTQNGSLRDALAATDATRLAADTPLGPAPLDAARSQLEQSYEPRHGGFGGAPKFPMTVYLVRLLRHWHATRATGEADRRALEMAVHSLERMAEGGMYDHLGGGFCRYSVDERWMIPHFEKMLYDNGPLLEATACAWQVTGKPLFARTARETAAWVMREMQGPEGGYYSSLDADSEGEEGKFYVWDKGEVEGLLEPAEYRALATRFGLDRGANFEGRWHLHGYHDLEDTARRLDLSPEETAALVDSARARLFARREERVRPGRDDKVLTSWNGLMARGMARAGRILGEAAWVASAEGAVDFIRTRLWDGERLLATCKDGRAHLNAYLDDYAFVMDALLALLEYRWRARDLAFCRALAEVVLERFEDRDHGGFFFTADDHEALIHRPKPLGDESVPSGNGVAARVFIRLGHLLGETRYLDAAERTLKAAWPALERLPYVHASLLEALEESLYPPEVVILRGEGPELAAWRDLAGAEFAPRRLVLPIPATARDLPPALAEKAPQGDGCTAYLCRDFTCSAPATTREGLAALLAHPA